MKKYIFLILFFMFLNLKCPEARQSGIEPKSDALGFLQDVNKEIKGSLKSIDDKFFKLSAQDQRFIKELFNPLLIAYVNELKYFERAS